MSDDRALFADRVAATKEEIRAAVQYQVRMWTYEEIENGNFDERSFQRFLHQHPEWDHVKAHAIISEEMELVKNELLRTG